jgi:hypothetical protein
MAFCNSCGATLNDGTKFCNKCGAASSAAAAASPAPMAPTGAPPAKGGSSALKIILVIIAVVVALGILGVVTVGVIGYRVAKNAHVHQDGDNVDVETPFGSVKTTKDISKIADQLGVEVYPGAEVDRGGASTATFGPIHTVTATLTSSDSLDKVCSFYKEKFPTAMTSTADDTHCTIVSNDHQNMITVAAQSSGSGTKIQISNVTKK